MSPMAGSAQGHAPGSGSGPGARTSMAAGSGAAIKTRQLTHLMSQLAQLSANLADTENLVRMTSVQAESVRVLGSWHGGLFMAASKVLGEDSVRDQGQGPAPQAG